MAGKLKGITIDIGGETTKLDKALSNSTKQSKSLTSELKQIDRALKFDPSNVELLTQRQQVLTEQIGATTDQLNVLKNAQAQVEAQFQRGEIGADQYRAFQREIQVTEGRLQSLQNQLDSTTGRLAEASGETTKTSSALDDLSATIKEQETALDVLRTAYMNAVLEQGESSEEAQKLAKEMQKLNKELEDSRGTLAGAESSADQFSGALKDTGDAAEETDGGFSIMKGALADLTSNVIQSAISAIGDFIGSLFDLSEATEEYRRNQAKLGGSAEQFGYSMDFASEKYKQLYSYVNDEQMATNAITNLMGLGLETDKVTNLVNGAIGTWTAYGDSIPIESLTESMAETINVGKVTGTLADTINWASRSNEEWAAILGNNTEAQKAFNKQIADGEAVEDAFSAALASTSNTGERANMVAELLNQTYGQSKTTYDETAGSMIEASEAQAELTEAQAELGQAMEPVNTVFDQFKTQALEAVTPLVQALAQAFLDLLNYLQQNPAVMNAVIAAVTALAVAFGVLAGALAIQGIITGVTKAIALLNTTLLANPIVLIVAAIAGLVAAFVMLWNNCEGFRQFWIDLWNAIVELFNQAVTAIGEWLNNLWTTVQEIWNNISTTISEVLNVIWTTITTVWNNIVTTISNVLNAIWTTVQTVWNTILTTISTVINAIWNVIQTVWNTILNVISTVCSTIWNTITNIWNGIKNTITNTVNGVKNTVSNVFNGVKNTVSSIFNGIKNTATNVWNGIRDAIKGPIEKARDLVQGAIDKIKGFFNFNISWPHIPMPHFSIKPSGWSIGDLLKGSIPSLGISWYKEGAILKRPTAFGLDSEGNVMVGGEAGMEAIAPITDLLQYVRQAVREVMHDFIAPDGMLLNRQINEQETATTRAAATGALIDLLNYYFPQLIDAQQHAILLDGKTLVGETVKEMDAQMAQLSKLKKRGV